MDKLFMVVKEIYANHKSSSLDIPEIDTENSTRKLLEGLEYLYSGHVPKAVEKLETLNFKVGPDEIREQLTFLQTIYLAEAYRVLGKLDSSLEMVSLYLTADNLLLKDDINWVDLECYVLYSRIFATFGHYEGVERILKRGKSLANLYNYTEYIGILNNIHGYISRIIGQSQIALNYHLEAIPILERHSLLTHYANCCENIGLIFYSRSNIEEAEFYFSKTLAIRTIIDDPFYTSSSYFNICKIYIDHEKLGNKSNFKTYFNELNSIAENTVNPTIRDRFLTIKALMTMNWKRYSFKLDAKNEFLKIAEKTKLSEINDICMLAIIEILIEEYEIFLSLEIIEESQKILESLLYETKLKNKTGLLFNLYILRARIELLQKNDEAVDISISKAKEVAYIYKLNDKTEFLGKFEGYIETQKKVQDFNEIVDDMQDTYAIRKLTKQLIKHGSLAFDDPLNQDVCFLISTNSGALIYSKQLGTEGLNEYLISNFLSAVISFCSEIMTNSVYENRDSLHEFNFNENNFLVSINNNLVYTYITKGENILAYKKLGKISKLLKDEEVIIRNIKPEITATMITTNEINLINKLVEEIFLEDYL